jgi:hypothetical protein
VFWNKIRNFFIKINFHWPLGFICLFGFNKFINAILKAGIKVGPDCGLGRTKSDLRSDQVGLGRIFRKFRNIRIFREIHKWKFAFFPALFTQCETAWQICKMDGDEGKTLYVIRFLDHFFENYCIERHLNCLIKIYISFNSRVQFWSLVW